MILDSFDHAFVINLDRETNKYALAQRRLQAVGIEAERLPAIVPTNKGLYESIGARGCTESHRLCVQLAKERSYQSVLIFEDDVIFRKNFCTLWQRLRPAVASSEYDLLYFYDWGRLALTWFNLRLVPIDGSYCFHAYVVHAKFYDRMLELYALNERIGKTGDDFIFTSKNARIIAPTYNLAGQDAGKSDVKDYVKDIRWSAHSKTFYRIPFRA